jgi:hypothetical protein
MHRFLAATAIAMLVTSAAPALASRVTTVSANTSFVSETAGACSSNPSDYDSYCPSGTCVCDKYSGKVNGALLGRGTIDISFIVDTGAAAPTSGPGCKPFFGLASFSALRDSETEDATGTICTTFGSTSKSPLQ